MRNKKMFLAVLISAIMAFLAGLLLGRRKSGRGTRSETDD